MSMSKLAIAAAMLRLASGQLTDKPVLQPNIDFGAIDQGLLDNLTPTQSTVDYWDAAYLPQVCKDRAEAAGFSANDIYAYNVHYSDCGDAWVMCRHNDAPIDETTGIDLFGRLAVAARSYVVHLLFLPGTRSAGSSGDSIQFNGDANQITVFMHETGHSLDGHAYMGDGGATGLSTSQYWTDAYNADSAISDDYAATSQQENVAQEGNIALYDKVVPGGANNLGADQVAQIQNQFHAIQNAPNGAVLLPGDKGGATACANRLPNSEPVTKVAASKRFAFDASKKPDVSIKTVPLFDLSNSTRIESDEMVLEHFDGFRITHSTKVRTHK
ncbi:hypothetical protein FH972_022440 [Carpinus fangiana]|uniref:Uncharacterized protein n=1 Tax=Carpinus fangiana TaxID=176857 RepID=A0A5N6KSK2_9ROSI|nr:hypothetical protein FH972_022440 [Carpinus fangiana]